MQDLTNTAIEQAHKRMKPTLIASLVITFTFLAVAVILFVLGRIAVPIILLVVGFFFLALFAGTKDNVRKFERYAWLIFKEKVTSISEIARRTGSTVKEVKDVLNHFRHMEAFRGIHLDWEETAPPTPADCPSCGAAGQSVQCEFCNSAIG